jgi:hypothetical protein
MIERAMASGEPAAAPFGSAFGFTAGAAAFSASSSLCHSRQRL